MSSIINKIKDKATGTSTPSGQHLAAIVSSEDSGLEITHRLPPFQASMSSSSK
jgi:hypothetical protein